jgi:glycosyltransferase involved in cell wall biosynthesis
VSGRAQPLITIVTVVLNGGKTLEKALLSVINQDFADYEYIVLDGGSTDSTLDIIHKYRHKITYWQSEPDNGVYDAMNKALTFLKGEWIYFLGADDYLICELGKVAAYLKDKSTIYYGDVYRPVINRRYDGSFSAYKLASRNICHQGIFYPQKVWEKHSYNLKYPVFADHELNMRCYADPELTMKYIPLTIAVFHDEGGLSPQQHDPAFESDRLRLIRENFPFPVYLLASIRFFFIRVLTAAGLHHMALKTYHFLLRRFRPADRGHGRQ